MIVFISIYIGIVMMLYIIVIILICILFTQKLMFITKILINLNEIVGGMIVGIYIWPHFLRIYHLIFFQSKILLII